MNSLAKWFRLSAAICVLTANPAIAGTKPPNILFIIMDDVGIDQLTAFNPTTTHPVPTPNIDTLIQSGVSFKNCWMMPECSPSRSCFFTGRWPIRTGVTAAILPYDLPSAQVSPYEVATPKILATAGYTSALVGKFHLGGPDNNPDGSRTPVVLGWDYYNGNLHGGPPFLDPTLGNQTSNTTLYPDGFPLGNQRGACWFQGPGNQIYCDDNHDALYSGNDCVTLGGIPALTASGSFARTCSEATIKPSFTNQNGYYVWPRVINDSSGLHLSLSRTYMTIANTDDALDWLKRQSQGNRPAKPWMLTVSYNAIHTPYQEPPTNLYPPGFTWPPEVPEGSTNDSQIKILSDLTLYAMDQEIGRLLVGAGLATRSPSGQVQYNPAASDTMIVLVGDNGTYLSSVKDPYDPLRSKATPYQTGVLAPMVVAGPMVRSPGRAVTNMVNAVDLFQLFGEIAGLDVHSLVPASHILDCQSVLPYLTNPVQPSIRRFNFTQLGNGVKPPSVQTWPCVLTVADMKIGNDFLFSARSLCEDDGGNWYGPGGTNLIYTNCCALRVVYTNLLIQPSNVWAVCNDRYKLVKSDHAPCDSNIDPFEFYDLQTNVFNTAVVLDTIGSDLLDTNIYPQLNDEQKRNLAELHIVLDAILNSEPVCYGDGNLDKIVNQEDFVGVHRFWGQPSRFDFNNDGTTDEKDLQCVLANFGHNCLTNGPGPPCP